MEIPTERDIFIHTNKMGVARYKVRRCISKCLLIGPEINGHVGFYLEHPIIEFRLLVLAKRVCERERLHPFVRTVIPPLVSCNNLQNRKLLYYLVCYSPFSFRCVQTWVVFYIYVDFGCAFFQLFSWCSCCRWFFFQLDPFIFQMCFCFMFDFQSIEPHTPFQSFMSHDEPLTAYPKWMTNPNIQSAVLCCIMLQNP